MDEVGSAVGGFLLGMACCFMIIVVSVRGCGAVPEDIKKIQRDRAIGQGIAKYYPTKRDSIVYDDERVRFVVEGKDNG